MCQTALISDQIICLGTRSFKQRLEGASVTMYSVVKLSRQYKSKTTGGLVEHKDDKADRKRNLQKVNDWDGYINQLLRG